MNISEKIKNVEKVINTFPEECRKNFYENIQTLAFEKRDYFNGATGSYIYDENKIIYVEEESIEHELFHMASSNREKCKTKITENICLGNGIQYRLEGENSFHNIGLNEGFIENLARKSNNNSCGRSFECFISGLLISIYGEKLYKFVLTNDPIGFHKYCSNNIWNLSHALDLYDKSLNAIEVVRSSKNSKLNGKTKKEHSQILMDIVLASIVESIKYIIIEYNSCEKAKISREELKEKIELYYANKSFLVFGNACKFLKTKIKEVIDDELMVDTQENDKKH